MDTLLISIITIIISLVMTIIIGIIAYFLKRYITQSDQRNREMHDQLNQSYEKLTETITQLRLAITTIQSETSGDRRRCDDKHSIIDQDIKNVKRSIGELWRSYNHFKDELRPYRNER